MTCSLTLPLDESCRVNKRPSQDSNPACSLTNPRLSGAAVSTSSLLPRDPALRFSFPAEVLCGKREWGWSPGAMLGKASLRQPTQPWVSNTLSAAPLSTDGSIDSALGSL